MAEAHVTVDAKVYVLEGEFGDGLVGFDDFFGHGHDVGLPVFEGAAEFLVVGFYDSSS